MNSVDEILENLRIRKQDLNNLTTSQVRNIFRKLTVKEISLLCRINRKFNTICNDESFWRIKVLDDYGLNKKYGKTWRKTAEKMFQFNMINLNDTWINGQTYGQLLNQAVETDKEHIRDYNIQEKEFLKLIGDDEDIACDFYLDILSDYDEKEIQELAMDKLDRELTDDELDSIAHILSKEIEIINMVNNLYHSPTFTGYLPGITEWYGSKAAKLPKFPTELIDPVLYVMQLSTFSRSDLLYEEPLSGDYD